MSLLFFFKSIGSSLTGFAAQAAGYAPVEEDKKFKSEFVFQQTGAQLAKETERLRMRRQEEDFAILQLIGGMV